MESNKKYGRLITDERFINNIIAELQEMVDNYGEYTHDGMSDLILERLDNLEIYPDDIDFIFEQLEF